MPLFSKKEKDYNLKVGKSSYIKNAKGQDVKVKSSNFKLNNKRMKA